MTFAGVSLIWPWCPSLERCILKDHKPHSPLHQGETRCAWRSRLIRQSIQAKWKFLEWHPTCVNTHTFVCHSILDKQGFKKQSNICHCIQNTICHTGGRRDYRYSPHYWDEWVFFHFINISKISMYPRAIIKYPAHLLYQPLFIHKCITGKTSRHEELCNALRCKYF